MFSSSSSVFHPLTVASNKIAFSAIIRAFHYHEASMCPTFFRMVILMSDDVERSQKTFHINSQ